MFHHRIVKKFHPRHGYLRTYIYNVVESEIDGNIKMPIVYLLEWQDSPQACIGALELIKADCIAHFGEIEEIK